MNVHGPMCGCVGCRELGSSSSKLPMAVMGECRMGSEADFGFGTMVADFQSRYAVRQGEERSDFLGVPSGLSGFFADNKMLIAGALLLALGAFFYFRKK